MPVFRIRDGYSRVTISSEDLKHIDESWDGGDLEWTTENPEVTVPETASDAILEELGVDQPGLVEVTPEA